LEALVREVRSEPNTGSTSRSPAATSGTSRDKNEAAAHNGLAWLLAIASRRSPERVREAVTLAERAVALDSGNGDIWNTLALARYRAGDWPGASSAIERSMRLRGGGDANDWVILAMIRWRQGDHAEARRWYDQATTQIKRQNRPDQDLRRLCDEASALIRMSPTAP